MSVADELTLLDEDITSARMGRMGSRVFDAIRQAIVQLKFRPGYLLSEADVARQLGAALGISNPSASGCNWLRYRPR